MSKWFRKVTEGIKIPGKFILGSMEQSGSKCPSCHKSIDNEEVERNYFLCSCNFHYRISPAEYFSILFDDKTGKELFTNIEAIDKLGFKDRISYLDRIRMMREKTGSKDAVTIAQGKVNGIETIIAAMDFSFIGGSTGSVEGEKISRAIDLARHNKIPFLVITKSGGVRIMESVFSLMQMAKIIAQISRLQDDHVPYIALLTDPTVGGVTSFAMLADIIMAEPDALIGYTAPKIINETIGKELPAGFQRSEFLLENGQIDFIVNRRDLKEKYSTLIRLLTH